MAGDGTGRDVVNHALRLNAVITIRGPRQLLRAFRKRLIKACTEEAPEAALTGRTAGRNQARQGGCGGEDRLAFDFSSTAGVPFPMLMAISAQYPDCVAVIDWSKGSASGETTIQNGQVKEASREAMLSGQTPQSVELTAGGVLHLALALDLERDDILGYCATAGAETWFKIPGTRATAGLRYQEAGRPVHPVNVKSIKLAEHAAGVIFSLTPDQTWIADLLRTTWGQPIPP